MGMACEIHPEPGLLRAVVSGVFSTDEAERTFVEMLDAVARLQTEKILVDGRTIKGEPDTIQRFLYGEFSARTVARYMMGTPGIPAASQFAYVLHEPVLDPARFGMIVATNRGMWVKAFDNMDAAMQWLASAPADSRPDVPR
jgi:hypothetical protein